MAIAGALTTQAKDNSRIVSEIDSIVQNGLPDGTDISVYIWDLNADSAIYAYRENVLNRPASTIKVLTAFTALGTLGADYDYKTLVKTDGVTDADSVLNGNLYLIGGIDPQLMESDIYGLVNEIRKCGIKRINGKVIGDVSAMDSIYWGSGWAWDDTPKSFQPYISPLMVHGGFVSVSVKPGQKGMPPSVKVVPESRYYEVRNTARTGSSSSTSFKIQRDWLNNRNTIVISGSSSRATSSELNIFGSDQFTLTLFTEYLEKAGISFDGTDWQKCPDGAVQLASVSHSLKSVLEEALKESVNLNAEAMMLQAAHTKTQSRVTFNSAAKFEEEYLKRAAKTGGSPFMIVDGSGLSMYDHVPATLFVNVLRQIYNDPDIYTFFYESLPISGYDGTLKQRLTDKATAGKIHAKTGTLTGSCTLAGYARTADGRDLAFCIMNSGALKMAPSRRVQDAICTILCE